MKKIFLICGIAVLIPYNNAIATAVKVCMAEAYAGGSIVNDVVNCASSVTQGYNGYGVTTCITCESGYEKETLQVSVPGCSLPINYYSCKEICNGCSNCTSDTSWGFAGTGYEKKATRSCDCNTCITSYSYRCASGYYGSSSNGTSGCSRCPSSGGIYGSSAAGSTAITSCYIPSGTSISDSSGTYTYTSNCYYSN